MQEHLKKQAFNIVRKRSLCSYMNDTKWNELRNAMLYEMPFPPAYVVKTLFENKCPEEKSLLKPTYYGDWYEGFAYGEYFNGGFAIEWLKINPRFLKHRGCLIKPEVIDASHDLENILEKYNIPYEKQNYIYCIYGYGQGVIL